MAKIKYTRLGTNRITVATSGEREISVSELVQGTVDPGYKPLEITVSKKVTVIVAKNEKLTDE